MQKAWIHPDCSADLQGSEFASSLLGCQVAGLQLLLAVRCPLLQLTDAPHALLSLHGASHTVCVS